RRSTRDRSTIMAAKPAATSHYQFSGIYIDVTANSETIGISNNNAPNKTGSLTLSDGSVLTMDGSTLVDTAGNSAQSITIASTYAGNVRVSGNNSGDTVIGLGTGHYTFVGGNGKDTLTGGSNDDNLSGANGVD